MSKGDQQTMNFYYSKHLFALASITYNSSIHTYILYHRLCPVPTQVHTTCIHTCVHTYVQTYANTNLVILPYILDAFIRLSAPYEVIWLKIIERTAIFGASTANEALKNL